jgi:RloB-like protein
MARRVQPERNLKRKTEFRTVKTVIKVFCEGIVTEHHYFNALRELPEVKDRAAVDLWLVKDNGVPLTLVNRACASKKASDEVDEFWCVFDVEAKADKPGRHPNLHEALDKAKANGIGVAVSNPSFEVWLALHLHTGPVPTAFLTTDAASKIRQRLDGSSGKEVDGNAYMPHRRLARERAEALERKHFLDGTVFPDNNPSSTVFRLMASIEP